MESWSQWGCCCAYYHAGFLLLEHCLSLCTTPIIIGLNTTPRVMVYDGYYGRTLGLIMVQSWLGHRVLSHLVLSWCIAIAMIAGETLDLTAHSQQQWCMAATLGMMLLCIIILITTLDWLIFNLSAEIKVAVINSADWQRQRTMMVVVLLSLSSVCFLISCQHVHHTSYINILLGWLVPSSRIQI